MAFLRLIFPFSLYIIRAIPFSGGGIGEGSIKVFKRVTIIGVHQ